MSSGSTALAHPGARFVDTQQVTDAVAEFERRGFAVLAPVRAAAYIPPGYQVSANVVEFTADDTYTAGGKTCLKRTALDRLAGAAGLSWVAEKCVRTDDGTDPHLCTYRVVVRVPAFDGGFSEVVASKTVDLREGAPAVVDVYERAQRKNKTKAKADAELAQMRLFIAEVCEAKAKNRAIRAALSLPAGFDSGHRGQFVALKLVHTGDYGDPEINREAARLRMLRDFGVEGVAAALYGPQAAHAAAPAPETKAPPQRAEQRDTDALDVPYSETTAEPEPLATEPQHTQQQPVQQALVMAPVDAALLADRKGKLGAGKNQVTEQQITGWAERQPDVFNRLVEKLRAMPDVAPPEAERPEWLPNDDETPGWMR